jgi:hypothetical protein
MRDRNMRLTSTVVVFGIFVLVLLIIVGERLATVLKPVPVPPRPLWTPEFNLRDPAPDFELADGKGKRHRLSGLVKGATFVCFAGDDEQTVRLFQYLGVLRKKLGRYAPRFITIAAFSPFKEAEFRRVTELPQFILYEGKGGSVAARYKAEPAPRIFSLTREGTVRSLGLSRMEASMLAIANTAALDLGFKSPNSPDVANRAPVPVGLDATDPMAGAATGSR